MIRAGALSLILITSVAWAEAPALEPLFSRSNRRLGAVLLIALEAPEGRLPLHAGADVLLAAPFFERTLGFQMQRISVPARNPSRRGIALALGNMSKYAAAADHPAFIYVSGAARCTGSQVLLLASDGEVPLDDLVAALSKLASKEKALILDLACDGLPPSKIARAEEAGIVVLGALGGAGRREFALDRPNGLFTTLWLSGLRGSADLDADGTISWAESAVYVRRRLELAAAAAPIVALARRGFEPLVEAPVVPTAEPKTERRLPVSEISVSWAGGTGRLLVDGIEVGETPAILRGLKPGTHTLEVRAASFRSSMAIEVQEGDQRSIQLPRGVELSPGVLITASPDSAVAHLGRQGSKTTPAMFDVAPGSYELFVTRPGYETAVQTVVVDEAVRGKVHVELRPAENAAYWSALMPQFGYERRLRERLWGGIRAQALLGLGGSFDNRPTSAAAFVAGGSVILRHVLYDPLATRSGFEVLGGISADYVSDGAGDGALLGTVVGFNGQLGVFSLGVELRTGLFDEHVALYFSPIVGIRHTF